MPMDVPLDLDGDGDVDGIDVAYYEGDLSILAAHFGEIL